MSDATVIDSLVALLNDQDSRVSSVAAASLVQLGRRDSILIDAMMMQLRDQYGYVRARTAKSLGQLGTSDAVVIDAMVAMLQDQESVVRSSVAAFLAQLDKTDATVISALVATLKDQDSDVRSSVADSISQLGKSDAHVIEAVVVLLKDQDRDVRDSAAKAIGKLSQGCSEWTDQRMMADLADNDSSVRERAGIVLAYRRQKVDSELAPDEARRLKDIRDQVEGLRKDASPWVKQASLHALYHIEKRKAELEAAARQQMAKAATTVP